MRKWNPKYKINLLQVFNRAYADKPQELRDKIRPFLRNEGLKFYYGELVQDRIIKNTQNNKNKHGSSMGTYSKRYKNSLVFKIYKGGKRNVDLTLTGEMLADIKPTQTAYTIVFGFEDEENRGKAQGHISGKYGKSKKVVRGRDFFGLPKREEELLLKKALKASIATNFQITANLYEQAVSAALGNFRIENEE